MRVSDTWRHVVPFELARTMEERPESALSVRAANFLESADRMLALMDDADAQGALRDAVRHQANVWVFG
jgi:hypothetical protein